MNRYIIITILLSFSIFACDMELDKTEVKDEIDTIPTKYRIGLIHGVAGPNDGGLNQQAVNILIDARARLDVEVESATIVGDNERTMTLLGMANTPNTKLIIGIGSEFSRAIDTIAIQFPNKKFICVDYYSEDYSNMPANLYGIRFAEDKGAYLAGVMAGISSTSNKVGFIGGMYNQRILGIRDGFTSGLRSVNPNATVSVLYVDSTNFGFRNEQKGQALADDMFATGVDVIYHAAGISGIGVIKSAQNNSKFAIGSDRDESFIAPTAVIGSIEKYSGVYLYQGIENAVTDNFKGGVIVVGLGDGALNYRLNEAVNLPIDRLKSVLEQTKANLITNTR